MRIFLVTLCLVGWLADGRIHAEEATEIPLVAPEEAAQYDGKIVTVKGKVEGQKTAASGVTYLNFGGRYPNHIFSCRAFSDKFPEGVPACEGKTVEVTGKIKLHEGKPSMDLKGPDKIKILEEEAVGEKSGP